MAQDIQNEVLRRDMPQLQGGNRMGEAMTHLDELVAEWWTEREVKG